MTLADLISDIEAEIRLCSTDLGVGWHDFWGSEGHDVRPAVELHTNTVSVEIESDPLDALPFRLEIQHGGGADAVPLVAELWAFDGVKGVATWRICFRD